MLTVALLAFLAQDWEADPPGWDLGDVLMNQEFTRDFQITARAPGKITAALATCACLSLELSDTTLAPGQRVLLHGRLRTSGLIGRHEKAFQLVIDDRSTLVIPVRFDVWSGAPPPTGEPPDLLLFYPADAPDRHDTLAALVRVASAQRRTYAVRAGPSYRLESRDRVVEGRADVLAFLDGLVPPPVSVTPSPPALPRDVRLRLRYFYWPTCIRCLGVARRFLPEIERRSAGRIEVRTLDLSQPGILAEYLAECRRAGVKPAASAAFVGRQVLLDDEVETGLDAALLAAAAEGNLPPTSRDAGLVEGQFVQMGSALIVLAGLADGINPCAFATIVFLISFLRLTHQSRRSLFMAGAVYALASFATYFLLGLGALVALRSLEGFWFASRALAWIVAAGAIGLGIVSLIDGIRYRARPSADVVILQLPTGAKQRIHAAIRGWLRGRRLILGGLIAGALVTLLESACTGQIYLPVLVAMTREPAWAARAWIYLCLYNLAFILPLVLVTVATVLGLSHQGLARWAEGHVPHLKFATAFLFLGLGSFLAYLSAS